MASNNSINRVTPLAELGQKPKVKPRPPVPTKLPEAQEDKGELVQASPDRPAPGTTAPLGRPGRPKGRGTSTSVYFSNPEHLEFVKELEAKYPNVSLSSILSQLLMAFVSSCGPNREANRTSVDVSTTVFI